jgi:hypothetical protein
MVKSDIENMKNMLWKKKPFPTKEYILCCILEELRELNEYVKQKELKK